MNEVERAGAGGLRSHLIHHHQRPHHQRAAPADDDCLQFGSLSSSVLSVRYRIW